MVTPAQTSRHLAPGDKLGKHDVIRRIAVGSVAELYLTRTLGAEGLEKLACVKRVLPRFAGDASFVTAFASEARLAATLSHPNIAQVSDVGQDAGETFFSMEYVHGEDLGRLVTASSDNGVPISLDCALTVAAGLCAGLHHAHEKAALDGKPVGMIHRDVSPTNVIVSYDGAVKIVDFGIARATGEPIAPGSVLKGKISYLSPEQARGRGAVDRRSDVFSVGTILYQLTTGRLPFIDETEPGVRLKISSTDPPRPSELVPGYAPALEAIVMRALARDPDARFATAMALQTQIEDFAHEHRLRVSPIVLARLMSTLFPARLEDWDHARAQGAFFVEQHVVHTLIENGKMADGSDPSVVPATAAEDAAAEDAIDQTSIDIDLAERTEIGLSSPRPDGAQPARTSRPAQSPAGTALPPVRASRPSQPGVTGRPPTPRAARPSSPLVNAAPGSQPRAGRPTQPPGPGPQPRSGRMSQPPPIAAAAAAQARGSEREHPVNSALVNPALPIVGSAQPGWPAAPSTHPAPQGATWPPSAHAHAHEPSLQSWAATSSPDASPWAATSSPDASPWAATSSPDASPWAATSSPDASPWGPAALTQVAPFGLQPSSQDLRVGRSATVPGMPGAVPITPLAAPHVPSGGTLVSSATLAGTQPPPVRPVHGPFGQGGLDGFAGQSGLDSFTSHGTPGLLGTAGSTGRPAAAAAAAPTLKIRVPRRSGFPLVAFALLGAAAVAAGAWFMAGTTEEPAAAPSPTTDRAHPAPSAPEPSATLTPPGVASTPSPSGAPAAPVPEPNAPRPGGAPPSEPRPGEPAQIAPSIPAVQAKPAQIAPPLPAVQAKPEPPKKKPVAAPVPDARAKPAKPRPRVEPKRGAKSPLKEQPWNDDSPFMPVATPKR